MEMKNIFYFHSINSIGGVESFFYYLVKKYEDRDITIIYSDGDDKQIARIAKFARIRKFKGEEIKCKIAFFNYNVDIIDHVTADEYIQIVHADLKALHMQYWIHPKITRILGVSQHVCDVVKEMTGRDCELAYNPLVIEKPKKILRLVSATRLTREKGRERMIKLGNALDRDGIKYEWNVFTNSLDEIQNDSIIFRKARFDLTDHLAAADYLVQLSDAEGYCYSVVEALALGTPVIVTDLPVYRELGLTEKNSFRLNMDMTDIPVEKIYKGLPKFTYTPIPDRWIEILAKGKSTYAEDKTRIIGIQVKKKYYDLELNRLVLRGETITTNYARAQMLIEKDLCEEV